MQKKIEKYEQHSKKSNVQQDAYNELLIKYNTLVYKNNTGSMENSTLDNAHSKSF